MNARYLTSSLLLSTLLAACGGGGPATQNNPSAASYTFVRPAAGEHLVYAQKLGDNLNNTVNRTMTMDVTAVNADGSFTVHEEDPSHNRIVSGTVDQSLYPSDYQYNPAGQAVSVTVTPATGAKVTCTNTQGNPGAPSPLAVGQTWAANYIETCGSGQGTAMNQTGTLAGMESVTVAAGTFSTFKFTSTITRTMNGTTRTETVTHWRDASGADSRTVKSMSVFSYSGATPPAGALLSESHELQSYR